MVQFFVMLELFSAAMAKQTILPKASGIDPKNVVEYMDRWSSQARKGTLELLLLLFIQKKEYYGYELIEDMKTILVAEVSEGTLYPLLNRMQKDELISSEWREMGSGVPRKYYTLTLFGKQILEAMKQEWLSISFAIQKLSM